MSAMLLSIKPVYAQAILEGKKIYEFRKRRCKEGITKIIFYSSSPVSQVVGEAEIEDIIEGSPSGIWELAKKQSGIPRAAYREYYKGTKTAIAYKLKNVKVYEEPKKLSDYGINHVPQSFVYVEE